MTVSYPLTSAKTRFRSRVIGANMLHAYGDLTDVELAEKKKEFQKLYEEELPLDPPDVEQKIAEQRQREYRDVYFCVPAFHSHQMAMYAAALKQAGSPTMRMHFVQDSVLVVDDIVDAVRRMFIEDIKLLPSIVPSRRDSREVKHTWGKPPRGGWR